MFTPVEHVEMNNQQQAKRNSLRKEKTIETSGELLCSHRFAQKGTAKASPRCETYPWIMASPLEDQTLSGIVSFRTGEEHPEPHQKSESGAAKLRK